MYSLRFQLTASQGGWRRLWATLTEFSFISTHSLTRRLTDRYIIVLYLLIVFQLTASQGGWRIYKCSCSDCSSISTHSLTRRLTEFSGILIRQRDFNSQPHKEADAWSNVLHSSWHKFQLTASQGGWPEKRRRCDYERYYFNSQPHKEADSLSRLWTICTKHFNSQPHKEADGKCALNPMVFEPFQLTASQGGWRERRL